MKPGTNKKLLLLLLSGLLFITVLAGCSLPAKVIPSGAPAASPEVARLGAIIVLTGDIAIYGQSQKRGIDLAVKEISDGSYLGSREFQVITLDPGSTDEGAVTVLNRLITEEKVVGIIGPTLSGQALAADPVAQQNRIPVVGVSNTASGIPKIGDFIFRCSLPESSVISGTVKKAADTLNIKKIGLLWGREDAYTIGGYEGFIGGAKAHGVQVIAEETFLRGDTDFKAQLERLLSQQPDALAVSAYVNEAVLITVQARELGFTGNILGGNGFNLPDVIIQAGAAAEGIVVGTAWSLDNKTPANNEFVAAYQNAYGVLPDQFAAQAYTGTWIFAEAIRLADSTDPVAIRDSLLKIRDLETPLGRFSFNEDREPVHPSIVQIVREGKFVILD